MAFDKKVLEKNENPRTAEKKNKNSRYTRQKNMFFFVNFGVYPINIL